MAGEDSRVLVLPIVCGAMEENAFLYADDTTKDAFLIDPGAEPDKLISTLNKHDLTLRGILLTHGHFDHIGAVKALTEVFHVPVYAFHDSEFLSDPYMNLSARFGKPIVISDYTPVSDGTIIKLSDASPCTLRVIAAPGHTSDSILFFDEVNRICFSGDTIFKGTYGNYMLP
ncbi:MAG: MBL fold metallo-hydrolase, partial [Erysipelotrichaceae bacterium]|nr:MBL fold metallo-hydrolase [Erysipelotrichaceae bacterium]